MWFYDISNVTKIRLHSLSLHKNKSRELFLSTVEKESVKSNCIFRYANKFEALIAVRVDRKFSSSRYVHKCIQNFRLPGYYSSDNCHLTIYRLFVDSECMPTLGESSLGIVEYASVTRSLSEVNAKRGRDLKFSNEDRFEIGKYAALHGPKSTIIKFKKEHPQLKESTVRAFWEKYQSSLKVKKVGTAITKKLPSLKRGRPLLLGTIDEKVKNFFFALRQKGGVVNTVVAIATAKALIERSKDEHLKLIDLESCYWAKNLFRRMGFVKRAYTTSRPEIP